MNNTINEDAAEAANTLIKHYMSQTDDFPSTVKSYVRGLGIPEHQAQMVKDCVIDNWENIGGGNTIFDTMTEGVATTLTKMSQDFDTPIPSMIEDLSPTVVTALVNQAGLMPWFHQIGVIKIK